MQEEIRRSDEAKYGHRLYGLLLVANGQSCRAAAGLLGEDPRTVQRWARTYERDGFDRLRDNPRIDRPRGKASRRTCATCRTASGWSATRGTSCCCASICGASTAWRSGGASAAAI